MQKCPLKDIAIGKLRNLCTDVGQRCKQKIPFLTSHPSAIAALHINTVGICLEISPSKPVLLSDSSFRRGSFVNPFVVLRP